MERKELIDSVEKTFKECMEILRAKQHDYATNEDALQNFRYAELVNVGPQKAALVRIAEKLSRVSNLIDKEEAVKDEKVADTIRDMINYMAILKAMVEEKPN